MGSTSQAGHGEELVLGCQRGGAPIQSPKAWSRFGPASEVKVWVPPFLGRMRARWIVVHPRAQCILAIINPPQALAKVNSCQFFFFVSCRYSSGWLLVPFLIFHDQHRDPKWCIRFQRLKTSRPAARASSPGGPPDRESERLHPDRAVVPGPRS